MSEQFEESLNLSFKIGLWAVILVCLFLFWDQTTEFYLMPKFITLVFLMGLILLFLSLRFLSEGKITYVRTKLDLSLLAILVAALLSTLLSPHKYISLFGQMPKIDTGLISITLYILFYFLTVNLVKKKEEVKTIINILIFSGAALSTLSSLSYFNLKVFPFSFTQSTNFTPSGSIFSTTAILTMLLPFLIIFILKSPNFYVKISYTALLCVFSVGLVLTGSLPIWVGASLALAITLLLYKDQQLSKNLIFLSIPLVLSLTLALLIFIPAASGFKNPFYDQAQSFPREIQLDPATSWQISISAFRDAPLLGTGPGSFLFNFSQYKPLDFNLSPFWNIRFDSAFNQYLQTLSEQGALGFLALVFLTLFFARSAILGMLSKRADLDTALFISGITFFIILLLHSGTLILFIIGVLILGLGQVAGGLTKKETAPAVMVNLSSDDTSRLNILPALFFMAVILSLGISFYQVGKFAMADWHHRKALTSIAQNQGLLAYNELIEAEKLSPQNDLYRINLAQTNFALANSIAQIKGPTEASSGGSLTDEDRKNIGQLLQQAISEGRTATSLSPRNPVNWEVLGSIYRQISGVAQNALSFSLDSYGRAIKLDPLNPLLRLNVGGIYYSIKNYDLAIRFFQDSVNLKPDFTNGLYNLSVALRDKGNLQEAQTVAERVVSLLTPSLPASGKASPDYQLVADYLADLKMRIATKTAQPSLIQAPAGEESAPLQKKTLPKVLNLPAPSQIATPAAVKKPSPTPTPRP